MSLEQRSLQVGGTLNPRKHIYIERPEDGQVLDLLRQGQYCNVLAPRQMGKSSLMAQTVYRLRAAGICAVSIDLAGDLGTPRNPEDWYLDFLGKLERDLGLGIDLPDWWSGQAAKTVNQKFLSFLGDELPHRLEAPLVIFLDEIDSTLRLAYADDLFLAIRTLYNDRALAPHYEKITFCLLGVATPNELIKNRVATAYNVGQMIELRDFDENRDDLSPLRRYLSPDEETGRLLLKRVLYWTGGHPYLTTRLCKQVTDAGVMDPAGVDALTKELFSDFERLGSDVHFQQVARFFGTRVSDAAATLDLYERIRARELDTGSPAHIELRLSGLVKRGDDGVLVVRNRIYERVFDLDWARKNKPDEPDSKLGDPAYQSFSRDIRDIRRFGYAGYAIGLLVVVLLAGLVFRTLDLDRQLRELSAPQNVSVHSLDIPGATRSAGSVDPVIVPKGTQYFVIELDLDRAESFSGYRAELRTEEEEILWSSQRLAPSTSGTILMGFSRSFLPAGNYKILLYGAAAKDEERLVAEYPMPVLYRG